MWTTKSTEVGRYKSEEHGGAEVVAVCEFSFGSKDMSDRLSFIDFKGSLKQMRRDDFLKLGFVKIGSAAAAAMGTMGGSSKSAAKRLAAQKNGALGGRPKKS